ncbi:hypothetical protein ACOSQ2_003461 [Xanthoceras sorbifolium]
MELWRFDHRPVLLRFISSSSPVVARCGCSRFFFEDRCVDLEGCHGINEDCWADFSGRVWRVQELAECLRKCAGNLRSWNRANLQLLRLEIGKK